MTPGVAAEVRKHSLSDPAFLHDDFKHELCACSRRARALPDGGVCFACGGMTVRTGTCTTCTECGETGGCG